MVNSDPRVLSADLKKTVDALLWQRTQMTRAFQNFLHDSKAIEQTLRKCQDDHCRPLLSKGKPDAESHAT